MLRQLRLAISVLIFCHSISSPAQEKYGFVKPPAPGIHPRIIFSPSELPELEQRTRNGPALVGFMAAQRAAQGFADTNSKVANLVAKLNGGEPALENELEVISGGIREGSFAAYVLQDQKLMDVVSQALMIYVERVPITSKLDFSRNLPGIAFGYDWLYNHLSQSQRQSVRKWLVAALNEYASELSGEAWGFEPNAQESRTFNWVGFACGAIGTSALAIEGEPGYNAQWYQSAASSLKDFLHYGIGSEGAPVESIWYFSYGMSNGALLLDAMARRGDLALEDPHLKNVPLWWAYDMFPWAHGDFNALQDTRDLMPGAGEIYYLLNLAWPNNPVMHWVYASYIQNHNGPPSDMTQALWATPVEEPRPESIPALPLTRYFVTNGLVYARTDWTSDGMYLEFQSDPVGVGGHAHADRDSFSLAGSGRLWIVDGGGWFPQDIFHNLVFIDGHAEGFFPERGNVIDYEDAGWATGVTGDAKDAYSWQAQQVPGAVMIGGIASTPYNAVKKAKRTAVLVRGTHAYAMIIDDIQKDLAPHEYAWMSLTPLGNTFVPMDAHRAVLVPTDSGANVAIDPAVDGNKRQALKTTFKLPQAGHYRLWLLAGRDYWTFWTWGGSIRIDGSNPIRFFAKAGDNSQMHWQPITPSQNAPDFILSPGEHSFELSEPHDEQVAYAALLIAPSTFDAVASNQLSIPPSYPMIRFASLPSLPTGWRVRAMDSTPPQMLFQVLNPQEASLSASVFQFVRPDNKEYDAGHGPEIRLSAAARTIEPKFRVLLYPHHKQDPLPNVVSNARNATITWPDGTIDKWTFATPTTINSAPATIAAIAQRCMPDGKILNLQMKPQLNQ
ncbi:hypothetical protein [Acidobacterium sp. S8]|uniref:hypothetical protein n=1 Tax=Acidobacterium sp. S8 TaxID=1641854 RepID=UPI00131C7A84|nr:hypothetical protein [Acidobacterium sp. S8]